MSPDPSDERPPQEEPAHDVLAAEAFAVPAPDPALRTRPVELPEDPSGIAEPHDILAAEEFAMPAGTPRPAPRSGFSGGGRPWIGAAVAGGLLALLRLRRGRG